MTGTQLLLYSVLLLAPVFSDHLSGVVNDHISVDTKALLIDLTDCMQLMELHNIQGQIQSLFGCIRSRISHCYKGTKILTNDSQLEMFKHDYCGSVASDKIEIESRHLILNIELMPNFVIKIDFIIFNFELHPSFRSHGMYFSYSTSTRHSFYHGRRIPWRAITTNNKARLVIITITNMEHRLNVFYSSYKRARISNIHHVNNIVFHKYALYNPYSVFKKLMRYKVDSFYLHIIARNVKQIQIMISSRMTSETNIVLYDGPGEKSRRLLNISCMLMCHHKQITSAFIACVKIEKLTSAIAHDFTITIQEIDNDHRPCKTKIVNGKFELFEQSSDANIEICYLIPTYKIESVSLQIDLRYTGPTIISDALSLECQYGGLFVANNVYYDEQRFCEHKYNYTFFGEGKSMLLVVVAWFPGYSSGYVSIVFNRDTQCVHHYLELRDLQKKTTIIDDTEDCQRFVNPPYSNYPQIRRHTFVFRGKSGRPIGSAYLRVFKLDSFYKCIAYLGITMSHLKYNLTAIEVINWPLGHRRNLNIYRSISDILLMKSEYLISAALSLPYICLAESRKKQMGIELRIASCGYSDAILQLIITPALGMHMFASECYGVTFSLNRTESPNLIYKEDPTVNYTATYIRTYYGGRCPVECRNFTYSVFIWDRFNKTVVELTANIGEILFTGFHFHGLRISVIGPKLPCEWHIDCDILIDFLSLHRIFRGHVNAMNKKNSVSNSDNSWTTNDITFRFYGKR